jgi:hypothetical protein
VTGSVCLEMLESKYRCKKVPKAGEPIGDRRQADIPMTVT